MNKQTIGIFDSGIGGLSIWNEINRLLPKESSIYIADSANAPYGEKTTEQIQELCIKNTEFLLAANCKLVIIACNTATTNAINLLRKKYDVPFIGIEPATKPAAINTKTGKIGILATKGTLASELFCNTSQKFRGDIQIIETIGKGLVSIIESGNISATKPLLKKYLLPMVTQGVDHLVLGCTHYPFLTPIIKEIIPSSVTIIDSGLPVAKRTKTVLTKHNLLNLAEETATYTFYSNSNTVILQQFLEKLTSKKYSVNRF